VETGRRIEAVGGNLTAAERRVAQAVLRDPQAVAFGTAASLAQSAGAGAATVVRLASKLGCDGFTDLQQVVQADLVASLGPAAERIHDLDPEDPAQPHGATEIANVQATLGAVVADTLDAVTVLLADELSTVVVLASDSAGGVASQFAGDLSALRPAVVRADANEVNVQRTIALAAPSGVVVAVDVARYDRWLLDACRAAGRAGCRLVALTDSVLSPLAALADHTFVLTVDSTTPFESHVGTLALMNRLVLTVADRIREPATERLTRVDDAWRVGGSLTER
jgi:DNA-binding MurR/RpiR family transcriptional regulator